MPPAAEWAGFHYDGQTANREPVTVTVTAQGLHLSRADGGMALWPFNELRRTGGVARRQLLLERSGDPPEGLVVEGTELLSVMAEVAPDDAARLRVARGVTAPSKHAVLWAAVGVAALLGGYLFGLPAFASWVAPRVPPGWEDRMGRAVVDRMAPASSRCDDPAQLSALGEIMSRLSSPVSGLRPADALGIIVADDSVVNAFAAPGRYLVVNLGLLRATDTPEELAGVLAHEAQHSLHHHPLRALARQIPMQIVVAALSGGNEGVAAAARTAGTLGVLRYQRADELEADTAGMRMIQAAKIDPKGMVDFMRKLAQRDKDLPRVASYLSTHPLTTDRAARLERLAAEARYTPVPLLSPDLWTRVKRACHTG